MNPLDLFPHEKAAAVEEAVRKAKATGIHPDLESDDAGERAIAGLSIASSGLATFGPSIASSILEMTMGDQAPRWKSEGYSGAKSLLDVVTAEKESIPKTKLLGLLPITERPKVTTPEFAAAFDELKKIGPVVDSFIDKHNLAKKGVTIDFHSGSFSSSPEYFRGAKRLNIPEVSKAGVLHELGHAADYTTRTGKIRSYLEPALKTGVLTALPIAYIAGDRIAEMIPGTVDDKAIRFMQDHSPAIMGATLGATTLYPEAKASISAIKHVAQTEGRPAAKALAKQLLPSFASYLFTAIPVMVGMSLARKYMRENRKENEGLQKKSGFAGHVVKDLLAYGKDLVDDVGHIASEIGHGSKKLITEPGTARKIISAAKETGQSPEFIAGALTAAVPATLGSLYLYGTPGGELIKERIPKGLERAYIQEAAPGSITGRASEEWRKQNPLRFAGIVGLGAALSGGIMAKFWSDLLKVV